MQFKSPFHYKKFNISNLKSIKLIFKEHVKFLVIQNSLDKHYQILIPYFLSLRIDSTKAFVEFSYVYLNSWERKIFESFLKNLNDTIFEEKKVVYKRTLTLKGLGFKILLGLDGLLTFRLGYSHSVMFKVPEKVKVYLKDNILTFESTSFDLLGNTVASVRKLKVPNSYVEKGFFRKYEVHSAKEYKKK